LNTPFPVGIFIYPEFFDKFTSATPLQANFISWDTNEYIDLYYSTIVINFIIIALYIGCLAFGGYHLYKRAKDEKLVINISTVCITLEILSSIVTILSRIFKIYFTIAQYVSISYRVDLTCAYMAFSFTLASGVFIIFFWINITSRKLYTGALLDKAYIPAFVFVVIIGLLLYIFSILWVANIDQRTIYFMVTVILIILSMVALIYFISAYKVYLYSKTKESVHRKLFRNITLKIVLSGVILVIVIIFSFITSYTVDITLRAAMTYLIRFSLVFRTFLTMEIFTTEKIKKSGTVPTIESHSMSDNSSLQKKNGYYRTLI